MRAIILMIALVVFCGCGSTADSTDPVMAEELAAVNGGSTDDANVEVLGDGPAHPLVGTSWQLAEFQSMSDEVGTTVPENHSDYTVSFIDDETLAMKLNCSLAKGSWSSTRAFDGQSGSIRIGPLAATRALCPPPSLDQKMATDMEYVRGYLLRDNMLSLSLMADGGIYLWEPLSATDK